MICASLGEFISCHYVPNLIDILLKHKKIFINWFLEVQDLKNRMILPRRSEKLKIARALQLHMSRVLTGDNFY